MKIEGTPEDMARMTTLFLTGALKTLAGIRLGSKEMKQMKQ